MLHASCFCLIAFRFFHYYFFIPLPFLALVFSFGLCYLVLCFLIPFLKAYLPDSPNGRSSHLKITPRGGGVSFVFVSIVSSVFALISDHSSLSTLLPLFAAPLAVVGLLDDRHDLPWTWRYVSHLFTAALMLRFSPLLDGSSLLFNSSFWLILSFIAFLLFAFTGIVNFVNFMDGLDGLVAGCMSVAFAAICIHLSLSWSSWVLVGSLLGFLSLNWSPAKVFMGDVGSTFLGAVFAGLAFQALNWFDFFGLIFLAFPLLADACVCVLRRLWAGQQVSQAHRLHLFQRLHQSGWPHARVSSLYIAATVLLAIALLWGGPAWVIALAPIELLFGIWLDQKVAVPFAVASLT